jgi:hypothetical protein
MPIVFEAPQPFSGAISAGYGAAEQQSRDLPAIASLYGQAAQIAQRANADAADNQYRNAAALGQQRLQASEFGAQQEAQARQFDLSRQVAVEHANAQRFDQSLRAAEFQRAPEIQQRQFELRAELNQAELSQQENLRLKQLQEYQGAIDADNSLSDEEKADLKLQVQAKVSPLAHRKAKAEVMLAQQHAEEYKQQALQRESVTRMNAELDAKTAPQRTVEIDMGDGTTAKLFQTGYDQNGRPTYTQIKSEKPTKPEKPVTRFGDEHGIFSFSLAHKEAEAEAQKAYPKDNDALDPKNPGKRADWYQKVMDRFQREHAMRHGDAAAPRTDDPAGPRRVPEDVINVGTAKLDGELKDVVTNPAVPEPLKDQATAASVVLKTVFAKHGTINPFLIPDDTDARAVRQAAEAFDAARKAAGAPGRAPATRLGALRSLSLGGVPVPSTVN